MNTALHPWAECRITPCLPRAGGNWGLKQAEKAERCAELTNRLQVVSLMRVFVQEEMIASRVLRDPFGEVGYLCGICMDQVYSLPLEIQFLVKGEKGKGERKFSITHREINTQALETQGEHEGWGRRAYVELKST